MAGIDGSLRVGGTNEYLETALVTTAAGINIHREGVCISDPVNASGRARVSSVTEAGDALSVRLAGGTQLDAFNRLRVSTARTLFDSQQEYGLDTRTTWAAVANGVAAVPASNGSAVSGANAVGPCNANTRLTPITVSGVANDYSVLQSSQYVRYIPGKSHLIFLTGIFSPGTVANLAARSGYFDGANGAFLEVLNGVASFVLRTSTSGSVSDVARAAQADWNIDKFDGTGPSGLTIDLTKTQILVMDAQWLGVGSVIFGFDIDRILYPAHAIHNANRMAVPYTQTFNLPIRMETRNVGGASAGGTIQFCCCSVQSEGGDEIRGFPQSAPIAAVPVGVTTRRPILSIRPKATFNGRINRAHIEEIEYAIRAITNDSLIELVLGGTLTGAVWTSAGADSIAEFDTTATAITGGSTTVRGFAIAGAGAAATLSVGAEDLRNPLVLRQIDALLISQASLTIVATSLAATSNLTPILNWHEQVI